MSFSHSCRALAALLLVLAASPALAFTPPRVGTQYLTTGMALDPGMIFDNTAPDLPGFSETSPVFGYSLRLGFMHAVATNVYAGAEASLGMTFFNEHTLSAVAQAESERTFSWQLSLGARFVPGGDDGGFFVGSGLHFFRASLEEAPLYIFGAEARLGWLFWKGNRLAMIELGYAFPLIQGLAFPTDFTGEAEPTASQDWSIHRLSIAITRGF